MIVTGYVVQLLRAPVALVCLLACAMCFKLKLPSHKTKASRTFLYESRTPTPAFVLFLQLSYPILHIFYVMTYTLVTTYAPLLRTSYYSLVVDY